MTKSYQLLRNKMSPESRKRAQNLARQLREEMRLAKATSSGGLPEAGKFLQRKDEHQAM
jgi:hypothetical protein